MLSTGKHPAAMEVPQTLPRTPGHHQEWLAACKGGPATFSNFGIAAQLTEVCLLGCLALRVGKKIEWDSPGLRAKNTPEADAFIRPPYRDGWHV